MTPHIEAKKEEIAKTVIMPGDPLRAKFIAETYLENFKQVNGVRGMLAFTGTYKGKEVTIMGSGKPTKNRHMATPVTISAFIMGMLLTVLSTLRVRRRRL